ncbi:MAG: type II secretion system protein [Phycisphaerae bacterium]|jgi:type II secretory pathway pseudopilin PulG
MVKIGGYDESAAAARAGLRPRLADSLRYRPQGRLLRPAFTLMELMVSVGVMLILMAMVAWIFRTATRASGAATGLNEIHGTLRTAQQTLESDFGGLLSDHFLAVWYQLTPVTDPVDPTRTRWVRADRMAFFTVGDHSSVRQLVDNGLVSGTVSVVPPDRLLESKRDFYQPLRSSIARVFLGHHGDPLRSSPLPTGNLNQWILARRARLLDPVLAAALPSTYDPMSNDVYEYDRYGLAEWEGQLTGNKAVNVFGNNGNGGWLGESPADPRMWMRRPIVDPRLPDPDPANPSRPSNGMHMMFLPGCGEFKIQRWIERWPGDGTPLGPYSPHGMPRWWPEEDLDGDGNPQEAGLCDFLDYPGAGQLQSAPLTLDIREYFNGPLAPPSTTGGVSTPYYPGGPAAGKWFAFSRNDVPKAIKITLRLYDQNARVPDGQVFTMTYTLR